MSDLKLCPFCGGEAYREGWINLRLESGPECSVCGSTAATVEAWEDRPHENKIKAEAIREAAKEMCEFKGFYHSVQYDEIIEYANKLEGVENS